MDLEWKGEFFRVVSVGKCLRYLSAQSGNPKPEYRRLDDDLYELDFRSFITFINNDSTWIWVKIWSSG